MCPVSGAGVNPDTAPSLEYNGNVYYFCCNGCKERFIADPETILSAPGTWGGCGGHGHGGHGHGHGHHHY